MKVLHVLLALPNANYNFGKDLEIFHLNKTILYISKDGELT